MGSPIVAAFVRSAVVPAIVATIIFYMLGGLKGPWRARWQGLTLALAFATGVYQLITRMNIPPSDVTEAFCWSALLLAVFVFWNPRPLGQRYIVRAAFVLALGFITFWPLRATITAPIYYRNLLAFFCLALGIWSIVEKTMGKVQPLTMILLPLISATSLSLMMLFSSSGVMAQSVSVLCGLFAGIFCLTLFKPERVSINAMLPFLSVLVVMMMAAAHFYLDVNPWHMIYLCFPFFVLWVREWFGFVPNKTLPEALTLGVISAAPLIYFVYTLSLKVGPLY